MTIIVSPARWAGHFLGQRVIPQAESPIARERVLIARANHRSGRKWQGRRVLPLDPDPAKAAIAEVFRRAYQRVLRDPTYIASSNARPSGAKQARQT